MEDNAKSEPKQENKSNIPACCNGCVRWERFGKNCFYYWEGKKHCTMWTDNWDDASMQQQ